MSTRKSISVTRTYQREPDACMHALIASLKKPVNLEGSPTLATLDDTRGEIKNDSRTKPRIP